MPGKRSTYLTIPLTISSCSTNLWRSLSFLLVCLPLGSTLLLLNIPSSICLMLTAKDSKFPCAARQHEEGNRKSYKKKRQTCKRKHVQSDVPAARASGDCPSTFFSLKYLISFLVEINFRKHWPMTSLEPLRAAACKRLQFLTLCKLLASLNLSEEFRFLFDARFEAIVSMWSIWGWQLRVSNSTSSGDVFVFFRVRWVSASAWFLSVSSPLSKGAFKSLRSSILSAKI